MESRLKENLNGKWENYIFPFFWQYGGYEKDILLELEKIYDCGIRAVCVESRPHPDYCGSRWWNDMDIIMDFARKHDMKVWLLDDDRFPTGHANRAFSDGMNPMSVLFLTVHNTDVLGPKNPGYMIVKSILTKDDELVSVVACRRKNTDNNELDFESTLNVTEFVKDGWLCWNVPEGLWRIMVFYTTHQGNGKLDYFNIVDTESVRVLLNRVYEPHYERYKDDFGKTFLGFFSDEPEFSNLPGYDFQARLGKNMKYIPWSQELMVMLKERWKYDFSRNLLALWYDCGNVTPHIRYEYMDTVTKQLKAAFSDQIKEWCENHGVSHIGHIVEDDNSHGRLGCSTGHYFRSISGMRMAGVDVVTQQIMPEMDQGEHQWVASSRDGEFFHYGLAKLGSSLAHIDGKKQGDSLCEIFGAYGWQEGIGLMKWLTDHMISRGINHFTPHAFSLKPYPDPDCPPHFYAHGNQPQYRHFGCLMDYMNRLSHLFSGGKYPAEIAVLYHADSEWAGDTMLYQKPVRILQQNQLDCDVIPADMLKDDNSYGAVFEDGIRVLKQCYRILLIPGCDYIPLSVAEYIAKKMEQVVCIFIGKKPKGICEQTDEEEILMEKVNLIEVASLECLVDRIKEIHKPIIEIEKNLPKLCIYPYIGADSNLYIFCFNESAREKYEFGMKITYGNLKDELIRYDVVHNRGYQIDCNYKDGYFKTDISLEPSEAIVLSVHKKTDSNFPVYEHYKETEITLEEWTICYQDVHETRWHELRQIKNNETFFDVTPWVANNCFCGTLSYETNVEIKDSQKGIYTMQIFGLVDCADIFVNGICTDRVIGTPMYADLQLKKGKNVIRIELPLTPVWRDGDPWSALTVLSQVGLSTRPKLLVK